MRTHSSFIAATRTLCQIAAALISLAFYSAASAQQTAIVGNSFAGSPSFSFDADGSVGPDHYAEITNNGLRVTALTDGTIVYSSPTLQEFWWDKAGIPTSYFGFDPHIEYDHATGRWFAISLSNARSENSSVLVGVSDTSDPSAGWKGLVIDADPSDLRWADYPQLGMDAVAIYIRLGMPRIEATTRDGTTLLVLPKSDLIGPTPVTTNLSRFTVVIPVPPAQPAPSDLYPYARPQIDYLGTASDGLLIDSVFQDWFCCGQTEWSFNTTYQKMTAQASGAATLVPSASTDEFRFDSPTNPAPPAPIPADRGRQPGTDHLLGFNYGNNNVRVGDSVYNVTFAPVNGRQGISWTRFQPSTNTIVDAGFIGDGTHDYLDPSIGANVHGEVVIAYTRVGSAEYASFYFSAGRPDGNGKLVFGQPMLLKAGTDIYDENGPRYSFSGAARFSDYSSAVSVHPSNPSHFWISGAYVSGRNMASTWISEIVVLEDPPMVTGDLDGNGSDEAVVDFGDAYGIWLWHNNPGWTPLHGLSPESMVTGDLDGNGQDELIIDFGSAYGIWTWQNNSTWVPLHAVSPASMVTGDVDGNGQDELIIDFGSAYGIWIWQNNATWVPLHGVSPETMVTGDLDGNGQDEVMIDFGAAFGIWIWNNNTAWVQLHGFSPDTMVTGDLDGNGQSELIINFGALYGIYIWQNNANWVQLHGTPSESMVTGDVDGNGQDELIIDFGSAYGIWIWQNNATWVPLHGVSPETMVTGDLDGNGRDDLIIDFGPDYGVWVLENNLSWDQLHNLSP